jgi:hypothetical protein
LLAGSTDQLEERLRAAQADKQHAEGQEAAGQRVLTRTINEKNKLQDANIKQAEELKDVRAQLSDALKENRKLKGGIFSMLFILTFVRSPDEKFYKCVSVGVLTGRPEEEVSKFQGDLLQELSKVHERARKAMRNMAKALWPADSPPGSMEELVNLFKGARRRFGLWKVSACREGAREAWAMVKTRYTRLDPNHMARVGPRGPDGQEIPVNLVYDQVKTAAKFSQQDCRLDSLLDDLEEEAFDSM